MTPEPLDAAPVARLLDGLQARNRDALARLAHQGVGLKEWAMLKLRVDVLTDHLLGDGEDRERFELRWERTVADLLAEVEGQAAKATLLRGVPGVEPA